MKKSIKNFDVVEFFKKNYKLVIPIALLLVVFIAFFVFAIISFGNDIKYDKEEEVYQYFYDKKYEYSAIVSKNRKDVIVDFKPQEVKVNLDSTPIYYKKGDKVILPRDMSVVMPTLNCAEYLSRGYSYITHKGNIYKLTTKNYDKQLNHYFFYDGADLYFFIEPVTLYFDNEKVELSPFSYVIAKYRKYISYYDKKTDTFKTIKTTDVEAKIENNYYLVYVNNDVINYQGSRVLLTSGIDNLNTIDMKD